MKSRHEGLDLRMVKQVYDSENGRGQLQSIQISEEQIEILARRLLPEIKRFFADENIRKEFAEWQLKRRDSQKWHTGYKGVVDFRQPPLWFFLLNGIIRTMPSGSILKFVFDVVEYAFRPKYFLREPFLFFCSTFGTSLQKYGTIYRVAQQIYTIFLQHSILWRAISCMREVLTTQRMPMNSIVPEFRRWYPCSLGINTDLSKGNTLLK